MSIATELEIISSNLDRWRVEGFLECQIYSKLTIPSKLYVIRILSYDCPLLERT